jgi:hypothetical protein
MSSRRSRFAVPLLALLVLSAIIAVQRAHAVDGVVLIDQSKVLAGGGFPFKIVTPGSYRLSGNLTLATAADGIDVSAAPVTIDLNGFTITGVNPSTFLGINGLAIGQLTVRNGVIRGFKFGLTSKGSLSARDLTIQNVTIGVESGLAADLTHLIVNADATGIECDSDCLVSECSVNAQFGVAGSSGSMVALNNNLVVSQSGFTMSYGLVLQNSIAASPAAAIVGVVGLNSLSIGAYGRNQIISGQFGTCTKFGTIVSMGDNVCNGVRQ